MGNSKLQKKLNVAQEKRNATKFVSFLNKETNIKPQEKVLDEDGNQTEYLLKYSDLICLVTMAPKPGGIKIDEVKQRQEILNKLKDHPQELTFNLNQIKLIKKLVNNFGWPRVSQEVIKFVEFIDQLKYEKN